MNKKLQVVSVNIGVANDLWTGQKTVKSAIVKSAVKGRVRVSALGLAGDEQVNLAVHGGHDKAVYLYPSEHYALWQKEYPMINLPFGRLGENLSLAGILEANVYIGDILRFPDCTLEITMPREPCSKFNAVLQDVMAARKMMRNGRCGFYARVLHEGTLGMGDEFVVEQGPQLISVAHAFNRD